MPKDDHLKFLSETQPFPLKESVENWEEKVVVSNRCSKVSKGGRRFSFSAFLVAGNRAGLIGYGLGKAKESTDAIRKASENAKKNVFKVALLPHTIPHEALGEFGGAQVFLKPACSGTGVVAGGGVRAVLELAGVKNVLSKSIGSNNKINVSRATIQALAGMRTKRQLDAIKSVEEELKN